MHGAIIREEERARQSAAARGRVTTERRQIVRQWERGVSGVLVTLVRASGSSYRRPGARLFLGEGGRLQAGGNGRAAHERTSVGSISGGCLEADLMRRAGWLAREGAVLEHYSTAFDDTAEIPFGLGCGGELDCLLERSDTAEFRALLEAMRASLGGIPSMVVTRLPGAGGLARAIVAEGGAIRFASAGMDLALVRAVAVESSPADAGEYFVERLETPQRLWVMGAGDDALPLVRLATLLGWRVTVADGRAQLARAERFLEAERVLVLDGGVPLEIAAADAVVLMTHSYEQDRELLARVLPIGPRYLGLLGARHRSSLLVSEVAAMLGWPLAACCAALHAPVGLDLGGDGPEAVALAIVAEVQACCNGRAGLTRLLTESEVRAQLAGEGAGRYAPVQCALDAV